MMCSLNVTANSFLLFLYLSCLSEPIDRDIWGTGAAGLCVGHERGSKFVKQPA